MSKLLLLFALGPLALAQTTWMGLRFGIGQDEVKRQMSGQGFDLHDTVAPELLACGKAITCLSATPNYELKLPEHAFAFQFRPELHFDSSGLSSIMLILDTPKMVEASQSKLDTLTIAVLSAQDIHDALAAKYGPPLDQSGPCNHITVGMLLQSPGLVRCETRWKADSQMIKVSWSYAPPRPYSHNVSRFSYLLQYQFQSNGL